MTSSPDPTLREYATTDFQRQVFDAVLSEGSHRKAAESLGLNHHGSVDQVMRALKRSAALKGYSPAHDMTKVVPDPFVVKGTSTYYDETGKPRAQWVKTSLDWGKRQQMIDAAYEAMAADVKRYKPVKPPKLIEDDLANVITITDLHVGMLAWAKEGGSDWNVNIAKRTAVGCFEMMLNRAPTAKTCVIAQLGDLLHYDGLLPLTPTSRHVLDADTRFGHMVDIAIEIMRAVIDLALAKHEKVVLLIAEGNHDIDGSAWLRRVLKTAYENEPRIEVLSNETPYYAYEFGEVMLFWHHGHMKPMSETLALIAATQFAPIWGRTKKRYGHTGNLHHRAEKEFSGMIFTQHPTLAARDAHSSRNGWDSVRAASAITYHRAGGEIMRHTVYPEMLPSL